MMESMASHFSKRIDYHILVPSYPYSKKARSTPMSKRMSAQLFGEEHVRRSIREFEPDLIYSDSTLHAAVLKLFLITSGKSVPFVIHLRGNWWQEYYSWFREATCRRKLLSSQQYCYNWFSLATSSRITPICQWLERVVNIHLPFKPTQVVYQGVDPLEFNSTSEQYDFDRPAVSIIQNHTILPKVLGLMKFSEVAKRLPSVNFYITEGEGYDQLYLSEVKRTMAGLQNVHFVKGVSNSNAVRKMLNSADCYVLATELDCCPTTVLEASLMQKPVVASRVGGVPETIRQGRTGWTIPNDNIDEWVSRLTRLLSSPEQRDEIGSEGRRWVAENFSWNKIASQVEELILKTVRR